MSPSTRSFSLLLLFAWLCFTVVNGQHIECTFDEHFRSAQASDSQFRKSVESYEHSYQNYVNENYKHIKNDAFLHLPIVVHVVHSGDSLGSISNPRDEGIIDAIEYTNQIFRQTNTEAEFQNPNYGADTEISFCLASRDEDGNPASGITRHFEPNGNPFFFSNFFWDTEKYINVAIIDQDAYCGAYFPNTDRIFISNKCLKGSEVLAHELGHYLSLRHTFLEEGECDNLDCTASGDFVCDTPPQKNSEVLAAEGFEGQACEHPGSSCQSDEDDTSDVNPYRSPSLGGLGNQPDAHSNIMGYGGSCRTNFTHGQTLRMQFNLKESRETLWGQISHCDQPVVSINDAGIDRIKVRSTGNCDQLVSIDCDIKNFGSSDIENIDILLFRGGQLIDSMHWNGVLLENKTASVIFDSVPTEFGENIFHVKCSNPNFVEDDNTSNNSNYIKLRTLGAKFKMIGKGKRISCEENSIDIGIQMISSGENFKFLWRRFNGLIEDTHRHDSIINVSIPDIYYLNIYSEDFCCVWKDTIQIFEEEAELRAVNVSPKFHTLTCSQDFIALYADNFIGFKYQWYSREGLIVGANSFVLRIEEAGEYRVKITNFQTGCESLSDWIEVIDRRADLPVSLEVSSQITCNNETVVIDGSKSVYEPGRYTYLWRDNLTKQVLGKGDSMLYLEVSYAGTFNLQITDHETICVNEAVIQVLRDDDVPNVNFGFMIFFNFDNTVPTRLYATGSNQGEHFTYQWATDGGEILEGDTTSSPLIKGYGKYELTIVNTQTGCSKSRVLELKKNAKIEKRFDCANNSNNSKTQIRFRIRELFGSQIEAEWINPAGVWSIDDGLIDTLPGAYSVKYFDGIDIICDTMIITPEMLYSPDAIISPVDSINCIDSEYTLSGEESKYNSESVFIWRDVDYSAIGDGVFVDGLDTGLYRLEVLNSLNSCSSNDTERVYLSKEYAYAQAGSDRELTCDSLEIELGLNDYGVEYEFKWSLITDKDTLVVGDSSRLNVASAGLYQLEMYNANNDCYSYDTAWVFGNSEDFIVSIESDFSRTSCDEIKMLLSIQNLEYFYNYQVKWILPNGEEIDRLILPIEQKGDYILELRSIDSGCSYVDTFYYEPPADLDIQYIKKDVSCPEDNDGEIMLSVVGGIPPYEIVNDQTEFYDLSPGLYSFEVIDSIGCKADVDVLIENPDPLEISEFLNTETGLKVESQGGMPPYAMEWNTGQETEAISKLEFGLTYSVTITDNNGCQVTGSTEYLPIQTGSSISILPNPARDEIQVYTEDNNFDGNLKIYDVAGACVKSVDNYHSLDKIDISQLSNGLYVVVLSDTENRFVSRFVVHK